MNIKNYLWIMPFWSFLLGYIFIQWFFRIGNITTPHLIGKHLHEAVPLISQYNLNLRIIKQIEDTYLPEGIILNQTPNPNTEIKPHQPLYVITTKKPIGIAAPECIGENIDALTSRLKNTEIHLQVSTLTHPYPAGLCFAQSPDPYQPLEKNKLLIYVSSGNNKPIIWPNFVNFSLLEVTQFLDNYHIKPYIINESSHFNPHTSIIIDQRPLAGTLLTIDTEQAPSVQLRVR